MGTLLCLVTHNLKLVAKQRSRTPFKRWILVFLAIATAVMANATAVMAMGSIVLSLSETLLPSLHWA